MEEIGVSECRVHWRSDMLPRGKLFMAGGTMEQARHNFSMPSWCVCGWKPWFLQEE